MITAKDIRQQFLSFFEKQGHQIVASSSLVPDNDPTLMFTNAGMNQFKNVFTEQETRDYNRAVTTQKCVRAGGKHNDLENVGQTSRHHTFFEMLGNFSFGDYFKADAIEFAWNLITKEFGLDPNRLLATVYAEDDEAYNLWKKIAGLPSERIIRIGTSDNFWQMGDTGPCGPCSEIFYDHGEHIAGDIPGSPDEDGDRWVEIWNLVFMQYDQIKPGERVLLPKPSIDTGMGLERIAAVLQGVHDNYDMDLFKTLIETSAQLSNTEAYGDHKISHRVVADHLRSMCFLIADGVLPSNEGRGYVLRRIMRRAMRHLHLMGVDAPLLYRMVPILQQLMGEAFPELNRAQALITETIKLEEQRFGRTLDRGMRLLADETGHLGARSTLDGQVAFKLYDTYGFPLDLTQDALKSRNIDVDIKGFEAAMEQQKAEARKHWAGSGDSATAKIWLELKEQLGPTEFLGYDMPQAQAVILALVDDQYRAVDAISKTGFLICNQTPFYAESGGQIADQGVIFTDTAKVKVLDVQQYADGLFVHQITVDEGSIATGDTITLEIDQLRRQQIAAHHSATHLLHEALSTVLGDHVAQKGAYKTVNRLRLDVSHLKAITADEIKQLEQIVNAQIRANTAVQTRIIQIDDARAQGAKALFGEKYGDEVRMVTMGGEHSQKAAWSVELCGGTHVQRTGDIGCFKIISEAALAAGIRRIEAVVAQAAIEKFQEESTMVNHMAALLNSAPVDMTARIEKLLGDKKQQDKELLDLKKKLASTSTSDSSKASELETIGDLAFVGKIINDIPAKELKAMVDEIRQQQKADMVVLIGNTEGKASVVIGINKDLTDQYNAVDYVRKAAEILGGKGGGGRPEMAQAGGNAPEKARQAIDAIKAMIVS